MASLLNRQLIARATGQASRRGLILRQPSGEQLLADVEAWLLFEYGDAVRRTNLRPTGSDQAQLLVAVHPAAPDLRMLAWDNGRVEVVAETVTAGPGYHRFVGRVLERLGLEQSITWSRVDPLDVTFGDRQMVEQSYLTWLGPRLVRAQKAAAAGGPAPQLGLPEGTRYTFQGAIATALGPRDAEWLEKAIADPRIAVEVTPWWADATDARYLLNRALCLMWLDVRWRAPAITGEAELIDEVHRLLTKAYPLEPGLPFPWHAWRELARVRGLYDHMAGQAIERAKREPAPHALIGYRRDHVVYTHGGWVLEVPGSFAEVRTEDELWVGGAGRTITLAATATGTPAGPMSAQAFLDQVAGDIGSAALTHRAGPLLGRARLMTDSSSGVEIGVVEGFMAVRGTGAVVRITFDDPEDWHWALDTWRGLVPA